MNGFEPIAPQMKEFESRLIEYSKSDNESVNMVSEHILTSGGKRFRPFLTLLFANMLGYSDRHMGLACAVELMHASSLLHDDVVDESSMRRGKPTVNSKYGNPTSVLVGDYLYTKSFSLLLKDGNDALNKVLINTMQIMTEGEIKQLMESHDVNVSEDSYFKIIRAKTSSLIEVACVSPALVTLGEDHPMTLACKEYGHRLGNAFQITDDVIDYISDSAVMGKNAGDDFLEGKLTLPLIHYLQIAEKSDRTSLIDLLTTESDSAVSARRTAFSEIRKKLIESGSIDYCIKAAKEQTKLANEALYPFKDSIYKERLKEISASIVSRLN